MEIKNRLLNYNNKVIYQNDLWFNFSLDSVLLSNFVVLLAKDKKILDIATGNAPIPMLLKLKYPNNNFVIDAVELQKPIYELGKKSIFENGWEREINIINDDICKYAKKELYDSYDIITCNPPFFKYNEESNKNNNDIKSIARHEIFLKLEDIISISSNLLKIGGKLVLVHRTERIIEIICLMKKYNIEPKRLQMVYTKEKGASKIVLIEGVKNGGIGIKILQPLYVHDKSGNYTEEIKKMFGN